ncbi:hypothetical protein T12_5603 [Trichinella patagoniensis]|uniref:Uncharacterized protein n=1 Tax=Trichinella patagoniensis TaxID=990121 RepID=A0A0V0Z2Z7_9BILA|nr:hypothetical protein T12_5603 [Trichinella patagoniensis]
MKLVPFATRVRMDAQPMALSNCVSYGSDVFPYHARREPHLE